MKKWFRRFWFIVVVFSFMGVVFGVSLWASLPSPEQIRGCLTTTMFEVKLCPGSPSYVKLNGISGSLKRAVIAAEDAHFYDHKGFDWQSIQSSFEKNLEEGRYVRGGSTITQQLAKNMFLSRHKTIWRKMREALITQEIERTLSKNEILERYLNVVQFGKSIFGVKSAAKFYFKKHPSQLTLNESVFLVFLLPSPEKYSHSFFRKELTSFARRRMKTLLNSLYKTGKVGEGEYRDAVDQLAYFPGAPPEPEPVVEDPLIEEILADQPPLQDEKPSEPAPTLDELENMTIEEN